MNSFTPNGQVHYALSTDGKMLTVTIPVRFQRRGGRKRIIAPDGGTGLVAPKNHRDETLIQALARGWSWRKLLDRGQVSNLTEIAVREKLSIGYVSRLFDISFLAPDIIAAILDGRQPQTLTLQGLRQHIPVAWEEQRRKYGFPAVEVA